MSNLEEKVTKLKQPRTRSRKDKTYNEYVGGGGENRGSFPPTSPTQSGILDYQFFLFLFSIVLLDSA